MPNVYVVNRAGHDLSDAQRFGDIVYLTEGPVDRFDTAQMFREIEDAMCDSEADDWILLTSLSVLCSISCAMFAAKHGRLNLLLWEPHERRYEPRTLTFLEWPDMEDKR